MDKIINNIHTQLYSIQLLLSGSRKIGSVRHNLDLEELSIEINNIDVPIPSCVQDRQNLKKDRIQAVKDLSKIVADKKRELETI